MESWQVIRTHISPYQGNDYTLKEKKLLESLPGVSYLSLAEAHSERPSILITNTHTQLAQLPPQLLQSTRLIIHPNSGYDHFAQEPQFWQNIPLVVGHTIRAQAVAEYTLSCLFQTLQLPHHPSWDAKRNWPRQLLRHSSIWVFGYGHIGKIVADTLATLGAAVTVVDPFIEQCPHHHLRQWSEGNPAAAAAVLICCSLNASSQHLFNQDFFQALSKDIVFINGARGALVKEAALREFLVSAPRAKVFMDVFEQEPFTDEWDQFPQVWKTSHIAGVHAELDEGIRQFSFSTLKDFLELPAEDFELKYRNELLKNKFRNGMLI
jgi:phosphoglycerate dehydrogenase-like enzyme